MKNLFDVPAEKRPGAELFESIINFVGSDSTDCGNEAPDLLVERIVSQGEVTPEGQWYDQERDEWVAVLEGKARLAFEDGSEQTLGCGDHLFLPARLKHRVIYTSSPCIWLAVHGKGLSFHK